MPVKEWIQQQWETRPNAVYFGSLILLILLAWLIGLASDSRSGHMVRQPCPVRHITAISYHVSVASKYITVKPTELSSRKLLLEARKKEEAPPSPDEAGWKIVILPKREIQEIIIRPALDRMPADITPYAYATTVRVGNQKQTWTKDFLTNPALHIPAGKAIVLDVSTGGTSAGKDQYGPSFPLYLEVR